MSPRIVIVGGGSYHWAPRLLCDFANTPSLAGADVVLHDLDAQRLELMEALGGEIARRRGIELRTTAELDRKRALDGADFVITCFSVGGFDSMQHDIEIPRSFGIRQPIGDSVGPGGVLRALRSIPVLLDIARDVEAVAPDASFVNVTNPLTALCRAVTSETSLKAVGLCNEWVGATFNLSLALGCGMQDLDPVLAGVNHFPIATELRVNGEDAFAQLYALMDDPERAASEPIWMDPPAAMKWEKVSPAPHWSKLDVIENNRVRFEVLRRFGVFPGSGDHHSVEFMPGFVHPGNDYGRGWRVHHYGMEGHRADAEADVAHYEAVRDATDVSRMPSGELVAPLLDGIVTGKARALPVNLPNAGNVTNLPDGSVVEIMGIADGSGVRGRDRATVPGVMGEFLRRINVVQEWTVEAARRGDRTLVLEAMMADPMAGQLAYDDIVTMTDRMLAATAPWLPQFAPAPM
jgi:alpha-galactosidase/6-phospho-beta-glucosidase family protein